jgi:hypothetical protein
MKKSNDPIQRIDDILIEGEISLLFEDYKQVQDFIKHEGTTISYENVYGEMIKKCENSGITIYVDSLGRLHNPHGAAVEAHVFMYRSRHEYWVNGKMENLNGGRAFMQEYDDGYGTYYPAEYFGY